MSPERCLATGAQVEKSNRVVCVSTCQELAVRAERQSEYDVWIFCYERLLLFRSGNIPDLNDCPVHTCSQETPVAAKGCHGQTPQLEVRLQPTGCNIPYLDCRIHASSKSLSSKSL